MLIECKIETINSAPGIIEITITSFNDESVLRLHLHIFPTLSQAIFALFLCRQALTNDLLT